MSSARQHSRQEPARSEDTRFESSETRRRSCHISRAVLALCAPTGSVYHNDDTDEAPLGYPVELRVLEPWTLRIRERTVHSARATARQPGQGIRWKPDTEGKWPEQRGEQARRLARVPRLAAEPRCRPEVAKVAAACAGVADAAPGAHELPSQE